MNEIDKFFGGLNGQDKKDESPIDLGHDDDQNPASKTGVPAKGDEDGEGEDGREPRKNRRHRRLEEQLQRERESNIALNERVKVLAEVSRGEPVAAGEMPPEWIALYGNTDESKAAWAMQNRMFSGLKEQAKQEALQEFQNQQAAAIQEQKEYEAFIDSELEEIEDEYDVDITSNAPAARKARREFLELVQQLSPKDENGTITGYADFAQTFELYRKTRSQGKQDNGTITRQKEIAGKTMQESNRNSAERPTFTPGFRGWEKDLNL